MAFIKTIGPGRDTPARHWIGHALGDGWLACYRLAFEGDGLARRARIVEFRIVPGRIDPRVPSLGFWDDDDVEQRLRKNADVFTPTPFSFDAVRREITARRFTDVLTAMTAVIVESPDPDARSAHGGPVARRADVARPRGRPVERSRDFYARFAVAYDKIENDVDRDPGESTRAKLVKRYRTTDALIGKWILTARRLGFLTPVIKGQRGGSVTQLAMNVITNTTKGKQSR